MKDIEDLKEIIIPLLIIVFLWYLIRRIFKAISDKINNAEVHRDDLLQVLEEIRDELKDLNKNNSIK
jgi:F0F1-type ATP synthase membrane subunit b/b'